MDIIDFGIAIHRAGFYLNTMTDEILDDNGKKLLTIFHPEVVDVLQDKVPCSRFIRMLCEKYAGPDIEI